MSAIAINRGMNLDIAARLARQLGASVQPRRRTGEVEFRHPAMARRVIVNGRRKDSPRALTSWLRDLELSIKERK
jgi:hypothetical protein